MIQYISSFLIYENETNNEIEYSFEKLINKLPSDIVNKLKNTEQNKKWHNEGSVYNHVKLVFNSVKELYGNDIVLLISAIFHDLGKIDTYKKVTLPNGEEKITFHGHENSSIEYLNKFIHLYSDIVSQDQIEEIYYIVSNHMRSHLYNDMKLKNQRKRDAFASHQYFRNVSKFSVADHMGRIVSNNNEAPV